MFFLLRSHNHDLLILWLNAASESRISIPAQKNFVGFMPLVLQPTRSRFDVTLPLQVGILESSWSIPFFSSNSSWVFLLGLHASLTVSSFNDGPKASLGHDPPAIEQIVPVAPIACRDSGDDRCCLRFSQSVDEVTVSDAFASCDARN